MNFHTVLELIGLLVPLFSAVASVFNGKVRAKQAAGEPISPFVARAGAVLNVGAVNLDKAMQLMQVVKAALPQKEEQVAEKQDE